MPPSSLPSIEPAQLLALEVGPRRARRRRLRPTGRFPRERTAVVLGMGGGAAQLAMGYAFRSYLPMLESVDPEAGRARGTGALRRALLPEWTEDSFPGFLLNVTAGPDRQPASTWAGRTTRSTPPAARRWPRRAWRSASWRSGAADMVILGGADTVQNPFTYLAFSKTHAFSPRGRCRPFDAGADGIVISEGVGVVVLKRLADAERDGDRIYAVIKGVGSSSDGRGRGLTAPSGEGQLRALRAGLREGRGLAGDASATSRPTARARPSATWSRSRPSPAFLRRGRRGARRSCVVGLGQVADRPHEVRRGPRRTDQRDRSPCITGSCRRRSASSGRTRRPTSHDGPLPGRAPRPAPGSATAATAPAAPASAPSASAGRTSTPSSKPTRATRRPAPTAPLPTGRPSCSSGGPTTATALLADVDRLLADARRRRPAGAPRPGAHARRPASTPEAVDRPTLAIVAGSHRRPAGPPRGRPRGDRPGRRRIDDPRGVFFAERPAVRRRAPVAFLFPGQGAQRPEMLGELAMRSTRSAADSSPSTPPCSPRAGRRSAR